MKRRRLKKEADKKYLEEMARQQLGDRRKMRFQNAIEKHARPGCKGVGNSSDQTDTDSEGNSRKMYSIQFQTSLTIKHRITVTQE